MPQATSTARATYDLAVSVENSAQYRVHYETGLLDRYGTLLAEVIGGARVVMLTDERVDRLYGDALRQSLARAGKRVDTLVVSEGERSKSLATFTRLLGDLGRLGLDRRGVLLCFGGGVITDTGGFVASAWMRGIRYVNFATSLIAQLDSSIGGKVAVNTDIAKNLVGAFWHPTHVGGDPCLLATLSARDYRSGLAEAIKVAIIVDADYFTFFESNRARIVSRDPRCMVQLIGRAAQIKMDLVGLDPYERDLRRPLNFGHTLGHPIETHFAYQGIRHGEAVAVGMGVATVMARQRGILSDGDATRILELLQQFDLLACSDPIDPRRVVEHLRMVRLIRGGQLHFVLPVAVGAVTITDSVSEQDIVNAFSGYEANCRERGCR